jgi:CTP synthase
VGEQKYKTRNIQFSIEKLNEVVSVALVAKYVNSDNDHVFYDAYASVIKALRHAAVFSSRRVEIIFINSEHLEPVKNGRSVDEFNAAWATLKSCQCVEGRNKR